MMCLNAEAAMGEMHSGSGGGSGPPPPPPPLLHGNIRPVNLGSPIQRLMPNKPGTGGRSTLFNDHSPSSSSSPYPSWNVSSCSVFEDMENSDAGITGRNDKMCHYRSQLEQEVKKLQLQLQDEIDMHVVLANAVGHDTVPSWDSSCKLPDKAQELLANIDALETTVCKLEQELIALNFRLSYERNERRLFETHLRYPSSPSLEAPSFNSGYTWEEHISSLRDSKLSGFQVPSHLLEKDLSSSYKHAQPVTVTRFSDRCTREEVSGPCSTSKEVMKKHWHNPNQLSEEMVRCMREIFICLSDSSTISSKLSSSESVHSISSPVGHLSRSSLTSFSDSSIVFSSIRTPSPESLHNSEDMDLDNTFDPYGVNRKVNWKNIGSYSLAAEVSWMSVGKAQLEYAAEALKRFRFLVEQLIKVNPALMNNKQRLAFWINLYNTLIMHAYLAYGVPRSDIKLFSLMQKASYSIGGQSFSAADIEYVMLKMKPPSHRPQIALILALHKFKISEEHRKYSIDNLEPLTVFALSCGMYSSPAVKIFSPDSVHEELENSMRDYMCASIGIGDKGKLLVPKLLHSYAKGIVEDSLLVDWICRYLTPDQVTIVRDFTSQRKQRLLGVRSFSLVPFDSRFRYLFLSDRKSPEISSCNGSV